MNNQEILDYAPEGATHWDDAQYYKYYKDDWFSFWVDWVAANDDVLYTACSLRSLADIAELVKLRKENAELENQQCDLVYSLLSIEHEKGGALGGDGQFYYKVPESLFKKAEELNHTVYNGALIGETEGWDSFGIGGAE